MTKETGFGGQNPDEKFTANELEQKADIENAAPVKNLALEAEPHKPLAPLKETPEIDRLYLEAIFDKMLNNKLAKKNEIIVLKKLYIERKNPVQINQELIKWGKGGFDPDRIHEIVEPLRQTIMREYSYELPSVFDLIMGRKAAGLQHRPKPKPSPAVQVEPGAGKVRPLSQEDIDHGRAHTVQVQDKPQSRWRKIINSALGKE
jgi:hypothetical protein